MAIWKGTTQEVRAWHGRRRRKTEPNRKSDKRREEGKRGRAGEEERQKERKEETEKDRGKQYQREGLVVSSGAGLRRHIRRKLRSAGMASPKGSLSSHGGI